MYALFFCFQKDVVNAWLIGWHADLKQECCCINGQLHEFTQLYYNEKVLETGKVVFSF